jgi:ribosomal protein S18 acetylase RimI-like enzyme
MKAQIKIRKMRLSDYEQVYRIWKSSPGVNLGLSDTKPYIKSYLKRNTGFSFVAINSTDKIIGTVLAGNDGRRGYIYHVSVIKKYRGKGIGTELMKRCIASLKKSGLERCTVFVDKDNKASKDLWEKEGWNYRKDLQVMHKNT